MTDEEKDVKPKAANSKLKQTFNTDVGVKNCTKSSGLKSRNKAIEFVMVWFMEICAEMDAEKGLSFEAPLTEGSNLDEIL